MIRFKRGNDMTEKNRNAYMARYAREKRTSITFKLSNQYDADLIETLKAIPRKTEWFKEKLREEMEKQKAGK